MEFVDGCGFAFGTVEIVSPLEVASPLEVFPSVISLGLAVSGVWALGLVAVIQIRPFVVAQPTLCLSVLEVQLVGSVVVYLDVFVPDWEWS